MEFILRYAGCISARLDGAVVDSTVVLTNQMERKSQRRKGADRRAWLETPEGVGKWAGRVRKAAMLWKTVKLTNSFVNNGEHWLL